MRAASVVLVVLAVGCGPSTPWAGPAPGSGKCTVETHPSAFTCVLIRQPRDGTTQQFDLWPGTNAVANDEPAAFISSPVAFSNGVYVGGSCNARYDLGLRRIEEWSSQSCQLRVTSTMRVGSGLEVHGTVEATLRNPKGETQKLLAGF